MRPKRVYFGVGLDVPRDARVADLRAYILDAVKTWSGQLAPDGWDGEESVGDPIRYLDQNSVKVSRIK